MNGDTRSPVEVLIAANFVETNRRLDDLHTLLKEVSEALARINNGFSASAGSQAPSQAA